MSDTHSDVRAPVPPEEIRLWVGPFHDARLFRQSGVDAVEILRGRCALEPNHSVLDVGCGAGRVALGLVEFLSAEGRYVGFDPRRTVIRWCEDNIQAVRPQFRFVHLDVRNESYNPDGALDQGTLRFPSDSESVDVAVLWSVFTHMRPDGVERYASELCRVVRPGGRCLISHLLMNERTERAVELGTTVFDFRHRLGPCTAFDRAEPTAGLAYDEDYAFGVLLRNGFDVDDVTYGNWRETRSHEIEHDLIVARRKNA